MEDKQLDFNRPLLSVRRFPSTAGSKKDVERKTNYSISGVPLLPSYRPELKSGPVSNPGSVPFTWEQSPGRPKDESTSENQAFDQPHIMPKLPPGRIVEIKQQENLSFSGREIGKSLSSSLSVSSVEENVSKFESYKDAIQEEEGSDSGDSDEAYLDALDTLSRTESSFLNCSLSGVSGLDGPEVKPSATFSTDAQTHDFMMNRFLPAAKAMTSETPQYAPWKQPVVKERPRQLREIIGGHKPPPTYRYRPNILPNYAEYNKEEEIDEDDDDYDEPGNLTTKVCGLLPRFCLKSSLCLMNPVPGMSVRTRASMSPASRTRARSPSTGSCQETMNERTRVAIHEQRSIGGAKETKTGEYRNVMRNNYNQVKLEGSSLYRRLQGSSISTQQNELPRSRFYEENGFRDIPKESEVDEINSPGSQKRPPISFRELLSDETTEREIDSATTMVEKTLYVDSIQKSVSSASNPLVSDGKGLPNSIQSDSEIVTKVKGLEDTPSADSLLKDIQNSNKSPNPADSCLLFCPGKLVLEPGMEIPKGFGNNQDLCKESITSADIKLSIKGYLDNEGQQQQQLTKVDKVDNSQEIESQIPLPPPPPKSPSESWLWRTLPSVSMRNSSSRPYLGTRMDSRLQASKIPPVDSKWEKIIKTTKMQDQHLPFPEELIAAATKK